MSISLDVHQITSSGGKFNIFLAISTAKNAPIHAISSEKKINFLWGGGIDPSPVGRGTPFHSLPLTRFGSALRPPEFQPDLRHWQQRSENNMD